MEAKGVLEYIGDQIKDLLEEIRGRELDEVKKPEDISLVQFILNNAKDLNEDSISMVFQSLKSQVNYAKICFEFPRQVE